MKHRLLLLGTGFLYVFMTAINVYQVAHQRWVGAGIMGFLISFLWTHNVKKIAFSDMWDRLFYAFGACVGTLSGLGLATVIY